jgi:hypothetical protein
MITRPLGKEYETVVGPDGRTRLVLNEKAAEAKLDVSTRLQRKRSNRVRVVKGAK